MGHLNALQLRLSNERVRLASAKSAREIETRKVWVAQIEKEIAGELAFLAAADGALPDLSDDELLAELS